LVEKPLTLDLDQIRSHCQQERIYRFRCLEGWSMVVPWLGVPLRSILKLAKPLSGTRYVRFTALHRPEEMPGQQQSLLSWPYREILRIDEAAHPLAFLATGMYGHDLPPQNGAPIRLVIPWKYGFKSIKAIQSIELIDKPERTTWQMAAPTEYGLFANVNPTVPHPRWSQRDELPLGHNERQPTLMFNGYGEQVAELYRGMDLSRYY
jgi:sulfoxide reductase catalytic subunit YedY